MRTEVIDVTYFCTFVSLLLITVNLEKWNFMGKLVVNKRA